MRLSEPRIAGVCAAVLTPLDAELQPDCAALVAHCRRLLATGCDAINLLGTTGEATSLSVAARLGAMEAVAGSGLPLQCFIVGTGAAAFADAAQLTRAAFDYGFSGALVVPPFYFKTITDDGAFRYYARLIETVNAADVRIYLYHFPQLSGVGLSPELVTRLATAYPRSIAGIKDSSGVAGYAESIVAACPALDVFPSSEAVLADGRARGFAGCISATLNVNASIAARVWRGAPGEAAGLTAIRTSIARHQLVPALRAVLASLSGDATWLRLIPPLIELDSATAAHLMAELDAQPAFGALREAYVCA